MISHICQGEIYNCTCKVCKHRLGSWKTKLYEDRGCSGWFLIKENLGILYMEYSDCGKLELSERFQSLSRRYFLFFFK